MHSECDCDIGGSIDNNCDKNTGQCRCHSRVEGRRCDRPIRAHYFPTLHQFKYEVEEGLTQSGPVRYRNSEESFPGYSWKGYVVFSVLQVLTYLCLSMFAALHCSRILLNTILFSERGHQHRAYIEIVALSNGTEVR